MSRYELDKDRQHGFEQAVRNNQPNLALQYLVYLVDHYNKEIARLEYMIQALEQTPEPPKTKAEPKKTEKANEPEQQ